MSMMHKQGRLLEGLGGGNMTETARGQRFLCLKTDSVWRRLMRGEKPRYEPPHLSRDVLGDTDTSLWPMGNDGPLDPWTWMVRLYLIRCSDGAARVFECTAGTAITEAEELIQRICWMGRDKDPQSSPIIVIDVRQDRDSRGRSWSVPTFTIDGWSDDAPPGAPAQNTPPPPPRPTIDVTPEPMPSPESPRPRLARGAFKQPGERSELETALDDEIHY
jgi:hypothetical protein